MTELWVDADACPGAVKDVLFRAAEKRGVATTLVANHGMRVPRSANVKFLQVPQGFDVADHEIVRRMAAGDIVVTADVPLAASVVEAGGHVVDPRGERYTKENIGQRLSMRNFMDELRGSGVQTGGPAAWSPRDTQRFADTLDRLLTEVGF